MSENRIYMQRYAMQFGTYMGIFWIVKFILFPLGMTHSFLSFLFLGLTVAVPFMGYRFARMYRDHFCEGAISFFQAYMFTLFMYMFAALLTAVAHYVYFRFIDQGFIINTLDSQIDQVAQMELPQLEGYVKLYRDALDSVRNLTAVNITMQLFSSNVFCGALLGLPTALLVMKSKKV
ncbi:MAG: DUF4199 domain-containing protein [Bacteroides sp.]|nr:DUF4199 domain-containing protein [Bacteroides sp.]